jgi:hypothetical protein
MYFKQKIKQSSTYFYAAALMLALLLIGSFGIKIDAAENDAASDTLIVETQETNQNTNEEDEQAEEKNIQEDAQAEPEESNKNTAAEEVSIESENEEPVTQAQETIENAAVQTEEPEPAEQEIIDEEMSDGEEYDGEDGMIIVYGQKILNGSKINPQDNGEQNIPADFEFEITTEDGQSYKAGCDATGAFDIAFYEYDAKAGDIYRLIMKEITENNHSDEFTFDDTIYQLLITMYEKDGKLYYKQAIDNDEQNSIPTFYNYSKNVDVELNKTFTDGNTNLPIQGASYQLYRKAIDQEEYEPLQEVQSTNAQGQIKWTGLEQNPDYSYYVKEISAPAGFKLDETYYKLTNQTEGNAASYFSWGEQIKQVLYTIDLTNEIETTSLDINKEIINYNGNEEMPLTFTMCINPNTSKILQSQSANKEQWEKVLNSLLPEMKAENVQAQLIQTDKENNIYQIDVKASKDFTFQISNLPVGATITVQEMVNNVSAKENEIYKTTIDGQEYAYIISNPSNTIILEEKNNELTIQNTFLENKTVLDIEGTKKLDGKPSEVPFTFILEIKDAQSDTWKELQKVENEKDGSFIFQDIEFDQEGDYSLRIKEQAKDGYTTDQSVYEIRVTAAYNPESKQLEANINEIIKTDTDENGKTIESTAEVIEFNNESIKEEAPEEEKEHPTEDKKETAKEEGKVPTAAITDQMMWMFILAGASLVILMCARKMKRFM